MPKVGIAITTYNRSALVSRHLAEFRRLTASNCIIVVADDGSTDDTVGVLRNSECDAFIAGANRGIAWNKNRGLYYLHNFTDCDTYVLVDDDVYPLIHGWDLEWLAATEACGHVNICRDSSHIVHGASTATSPGISGQVAGACMSFSRRVIAAIGYFDPRFGRYGHEHTDMSFRALRAGYGGVTVKSQSGNRSYFYVIGGGLAEQPAASHIDGESLRRNQDLLFQSMGEAVYRNPWSSDDDYRVLMQELATPGRGINPTEPLMAEFDCDLYLAANPDVAVAGSDPFMHYLCYGRSEGRSLGL